MALKSIDDKTIAKKALLNSLKIEDSLASLIKTESKILKRNTNIGNNYDDIKNINKTIKYLIYYLILIDDRMQKCLDIIQNNKEN